MPGQKHHLGLPPPVWGEVSLLEQEAHLAKDYPHQCGEKYKNPKFDYYGFGLPPPVWGEDEETIKIVVEKRITPTSVGRSPVYRIFDFWI